jgi:hypothetical protein
MIGTNKLQIDDSNKPPKSQTNFPSLSLKLTLKDKIRSLKLEDLKTFNNTRSTFGAMAMACIYFSRLSSDFKSHLCPHQHIKDSNLS